MEDVISARSLILVLTVSGGGTVPGLNVRRDCRAPRATEVRQQDVVNESSVPMFTVDAQEPES
jgi:hypothetical protein